MTKRKSKKRRKKLEKSAVGMVYISTPDGNKYIGVCLDIKFEINKESP